MNNRRSGVPLNPSHLLPSDSAFGELASHGRREEQPDRQSSEEDKEQVNRVESVFSIVGENEGGRVERMVRGWVKRVGDGRIGSGG